MEVLQANWDTLASKYSADTPLIQSIWEQLHDNYTGEDRHYHDLSHLKNMFKHLEGYPGAIQDRDSLEFAIWFHDVIYDSSQSDNEEQSAAIAKQQMTRLGVPFRQVERTFAHILATKTHETPKDADTALLLDLDLSILGDTWENYNGYTAGVRKEYAQYSDELYHAGRSKVLQHFLAMPSIYKTSHFRALLEEDAKKNLARELDLL